MQLSRKQVARVGLVGLMAVALSAPAWAGQVNLAQRVTLISETVTNSVQTIDAGSITATAINNSLVTTDASIEELLREFLTARLSKSKH